MQRALSSITMNFKGIVTLIGNYLLSYSTAIYIGISTLQTFMGLVDMNWDTLVCDGGCLSIAQQNSGSNTSDVVDGHEDVAYRPVSPSNLPAEEWKLTWSRRVDTVVGRARDSQGLAILRELCFQEDKEGA